MKKTLRKNKNKPITIIVLVCIIIVAGLVTGYLLRRSQMNQSTGDYPSVQLTTGPESDNGEKTTINDPAPQTGTNNSYYEEKYGEVPDNNTTDITSDNNRFLLPEEEL